MINIYFYFSLSNGRFFKSLICCLSAFIRYTISNVKKPKKIKSEVIGYIAIPEIDSK